MSKKFTIHRDGKLPQWVEVTDEKLMITHLMRNSDGHVLGGETIVDFTSPQQAKDFTEGFQYAIMSSPNTRITDGWDQIKGLKKDNTNS